MLFAWLTWLMRFSLRGWRGPFAPFSTSCYCRRRRGGGSIVWGRRESSTQHIFVKWVFIFWQKKNGGRREGIVLFPHVWKRKISFNISLKSLLLFLPSISLLYFPLFLLKRSFNFSFCMSKVLLPSSPSLFSSFSSSHIAALSALEMSIPVLILASRK